MQLSFIEAMSSLCSPITMKPVRTETGREVTFEDGNGQSVVAVYSGKKLESYVYNLRG